MTEPFVGEIQLFGFNFPPRGWAQCNGATLSIQQNTALFALLGTQYGGNGQTTFQLPNLASRAACHQGTGPGLSPRSIGESFGAMSVALGASEIAAHNHALQVFAQRDNTKRAASPSPGNALTTPNASVPFAPGDSAPVGLAANVIAADGGNVAHENRQPYLAVNFCIALQGVFPSFG